MTTNLLVKFIFLCATFLFPFLVSAQPDIIVDRIFYPSSLKQYGKFNGFITVKNIGTSAVDNFNVTNIYFSKDSIYSGDDVYGGFINFTSLAVGDTLTKAIVGAANQFGVNANSEFKYVIARADYRSEVTESDETNNYKSGRVDIENALVDLAVKSAVKNGPNPVRQGDNLSITIKLINLGTDPIHNTFYEYFISADNVLDANDIKIGYLHYASFYWNMETAHTDTPAVPATLDPGIYNVFVRINTDGQELDIVDYDLSNNVYNMFQIDVKGDLVNSTLNFDQEFGARSWEEDNHTWKWTNGWDNIRNYSAKSGSAHAMAAPGIGAKLSTNSCIDIEGLWIKVDFPSNFSSLELKGYDNHGNVLYTLPLNPQSYSQYAYVTLNWENVKNFQVNHGIIDQLFGGGVFYDEMDYTYNIDQTNPVIQCPPYYYSNCQSSIVPDYSKLLSVSDDCGEIVFTQTPEPGTVFTTEQIKIFFRATDESDNYTTCQFWISKGSPSTIDEVACFDYTSPSGKIWNTSGIYKDTLTNYVGCDSIITVNLTIKAVDTLVLFNQTELIANADGAAYQWLKCDESGGYSLLDGEINKTYSLTEAGMFAVEVTQDGCTAISNCHTIIVVGIEENLDETLFSFPNPTSDNVTINLGKIYDHVSYVLKNNAGQVLSTKYMGAIDTIHLNMKDYPTGLYFFDVLSNGRKFSVIKVIKK